MSTCAYTPPATQAAKSTPLPPRDLNGGLYTGEPFKKDAPWANVPVIPDVTYMMQYNLLSANPPPGVAHHYPGTIRPGNNEYDMQGIEKISKYNLFCGSKPSAVSLQVVPECKCHKCKMSKYYYIK